MKIVDDLLNLGGSAQQCRTHQQAAEEIERLHNINERLSHDLMATKNQIFWVLENLDDLRKRDAVRHCLQKEYDALRLLCQILETI